MLNKSRPLRVPLINPPPFFPAKAAAFSAENFVKTRREEILGPAVIAELRMLHLPALGAGCQDQRLLPVRLGLEPAGGGGLARRGGWWAGESSAGILGGKASFVPVGREGRGAERCLLPALRKVTGDLPEGYLGAGTRREPAPLKKLEAVNTRQWQECGWEACPSVLGEFPVW